MRSTILAGVLITVAVATGAFAQADHHDHASPKVSAPAQHDHGAVKVNGRSKGAKKDKCAECAMCKGMMANERAGAAKGDKMASGMMGGMVAKGGGMMGMMGGMKAGGSGQHADTSGTVTVAPDGSVYILRGTSVYKYDASLQLLKQAELPPTVPAAAPEEHHH